MSKSRPAVMKKNFLSCCVKFLCRIESDCIEKSGSRMNLDASSFDAASASHVRLKDAYLGGLKEERQGDLSHEKEETDDSESEPWYYKLVARTNEACGRPLAGETTESLSSAFQRSQSNKEATLEHFLAISPHTLPKMETVFDIVRKIYGRPSDDHVEDLDVNVAIWGVFMNATPKAAVHFGKDYDTNLRFVKNSSLENNRTAFQRNRKADQWSDRNHWHKPDQFPRFEVGIDKLIAQSSLSICHCQGCALLGKNGRRSC